MFQLKDEWLYTDAEHREAVAGQRKRAEGTQLRMENERLKEEAAEQQKQNDLLREQIQRLRDLKVELSKLADDRQKHIESLKRELAWTLDRDNRTIAELTKQRDEAAAEVDARGHRIKGLEADARRLRDINGGPNTFSERIVDADERGKEVEVLLRKLGDANVEIGRQKGWLGTAVALRDIYQKGQLEAEGKILRIQGVLLELQHAHEAVTEDFCIRCRLERAMDGR